MNEERAREIAIRIRDEFEGLLDEKNILIPSADREGVPGEARLCGKENSRLVEAIVHLLVRYADGITLEGDTADASHPLRQLAIRVCEEFGDLLADKSIMIPSADREEGAEEASLYGSEYYALEDGVVEILMEELGVAATSEQAGAISDETRAAVATMQEAIAAAPEGFREDRSLTADVQRASRRSQVAFGDGRHGAGPGCLFAVSRLCRLSTWTGPATMGSATHPGCLAGARHGGQIRRPLRHRGQGRGGPSVGTRGVRSLPPRPTR